MQLLIKLTILLKVYISLWSNPITLHVNESKRIIPEGDLWIEITGFPNDRTPAVVTLGIAPEDGARI